MSVFRRFKDCEKQLQESKGSFFFSLLFLHFLFLLELVLIGFVASVLAKEAGDDEDMAEMIGSEINSLSKEIEELEKQLKVFAYDPFIPHHVIRQCSWTWFHSLVVSKYEDAPCFS